MLPACSRPLSFAVAQMDFSSNLTQRRCARKSQGGFLVALVDWDLLVNCIHCSKFRLLPRFCSGCRKNRTSEPSPAGLAEVAPEGVRQPRGCALLSSGYLRPDFAQRSGLCGWITQRHPAGNSEPRSTSSSTLIGWAAFGWVPICPDLCLSTCKMKGE